MIEADRLTKRFGPVTAVDELSFTVRPGHVTGFLGPNGAGKTTTMRLILGLDAPTGGTARVNRKRYAELIRPLHQVGALLDATALHGGPFSAIVAAAIANQPAGTAPVDPLLPGFASLEYAVLAVSVLGVLAFSTEYSTGLIRTTFAAMPRRRVVLAAKAAVIGAVTLVVGELVAFASFFLAQAILSGHHLGVSLSTPGVAGAVLAEGILLFVVAMLGLALGAIVRHTAGGIAAVVGLIFLPAIAGLLPAPWGGRVGRFTVLEAAHQVTALHPAVSLFSPALSLLVLLAWPAAALLIAGLLITRRDA
jgi:ABC-2 type transport system permease protein